MLVLISKYFCYCKNKFQFGRECWSWYLQYFCIFECYCKNISLWEGVLVLKSTISLYICILACYCKNISLWEGVLALKGPIYRRNYNNSSPPPEPCLAPSLASIYVTVSPPNYDNVRFPPPWGMRWGNKTGGKTRGETGGKMRGKTGETRGKMRGETGGKMAQSEIILGLDLQYFCIGSPPPVLEKSSLICTWHSHFRCAPPPQ